MAGFSFAKNQLPSGGRKSLWCVESTAFTGAGGRFSNAMVIKGPRPQLGAEAAGSSLVQGGS